MLSALERERQARIAANQQRLQEIGLLQAVQTIARAQTVAAAERRAQARAAKAARRAADPSGASRRVRRSERVAGIEPPNYNENAQLLSLADGGGGESGRDRRLMRENISEEIYGVGHLDVLGSHKQEWELFVDGYNSNGERIYDKVNGQTCHQCRQKTLGKRTSCSGCGSLQGVLCGDCLFMRYGENVDEANANPDWLCPLCRDICNCSFHRSKRGWAPTGTLYRRAIAEGYTSVAHYLVLNNLNDEAKPVALERGMCPPELAAELKKEIAEAGKKAAGPAPAGQQTAVEAKGREEVQEGSAATAAGEKSAAVAAPAAVEAQLLQPEVEAAAEPASAAARSRGTSQQRTADQQQKEQQPAPEQQQKKQVSVSVPRKRKQGTIQLGAAAAAGKKQKGEQKGAAADATERRGLRSSARVRA